MASVHSSVPPRIGGDPDARRQSRRQRVLLASAEGRRIRADAGFIRRYPAGRPGRRRAAARRCAGNPCEAPPQVHAPNPFGLRSPARRRLITLPADREAAIPPAQAARAAHRVRAKSCEVPASGDPGALSPPTQQPDRSSGVAEAPRSNAADLSGAPLPPIRPATLGKPAKHDKRTKTHQRRRGRFRTSRRRRKPGRPSARQSFPPPVRRHFPLSRFRATQAASCSFRRRGSRP